MMRALVVLAVVLGWVTPARAEYKIVLVKSKLTVKSGKRTAPLGGDLWFELKDLVVDKRAKRVSFVASSECATETKQTFSFDQLEARLQNTAALTLHRKQKWANAAKGFAEAVRLDPAWNLAAYNLASARTRLGDQDGAVAALAPWLAAEPVATYLKVALDPELQPLLAHAALVKLKATAPGTMKVDKGRVTGRYGYNAARGIVVGEIVEGDGMSCTELVHLDWFDATTGKRLGSLPLATIGDPGCEDDSRKVTLIDPDRAAVADRVLADLGMVATDFEYATGTETDTGAHVVRFPKAKLGVAHDDAGTARLLRGNTVLATITTGESRLISGAYLSKAKLVLLSTHRPSDACPANASDGMTVP